MLEHDQAQMPAHFDSLEAQTLAPLPIPKDKRGRIRWKVLREDPALLHLVIETEGVRAANLGIPFTNLALIRVGFGPLSHAITNDYPGGMIALRAKIGLGNTRRSPNFWAGEEGIERIRAEARRIFEERGKLSANILRASGRVDLGSAIARGYPGGMLGLKRDIGVTHQYKPNGYWTPEIIEKEAKDFFLRAGNISYAQLLSGHQAGLAGAINNHYPGGMIALKINIGIEHSQKPRSYWTRETIEQEAASFVEEFGQITHGLMSKNGRGDLAIQISLKYPGGVYGLREKLGLVVPRLPRGFWTKERVEEEAFKLFQSNGELDSSVVRNSNIRGLSKAVQRYPGGFSALKEKLGITVSTSTEQPMSSDEANEQLRKLLEEQI